MEETEQTEMSEEQLAEQISKLVGTTPTAEEKQNVHTFLHNVAIAKDTTKLGYLKDEEIGMPLLPVRTLHELAVFCSNVADMDYFSDYLKAEAEITTSTSLSRNAKLVSLAVLQKKEVSDVTKPVKSNKGWFQKKEQKTATELT